MASVIFFVLLFFFFWRGGGRFVGWFGSVWFGLLFASPNELRDWMCHFLDLWSLSMCIVGQKRKPQRGTTGSGRLSFYQLVFVFGYPVTHTGSG